MLGIVADAGRAGAVESAFRETRERFGGVDLVVDAITATPRGGFGGGSMLGVEEEFASAVAYLGGQSPRAWTHELQLTPAGDRWVR